MGVITADGLVLVRYRGGPGETVTVRIGDRVRLFNHWTGTAHCWTERGVSVRLDRPLPWAQYPRMEAWAVDAGDDDIAEVLERVADRKKATAEAK